MKPIEEHIVLITGATDGIGRLTAHELACQGATVLVHGRNPDRVAATVAAIGATTDPDNVKGFVADFEALASIRQLAKDVSAVHPSLDVLINNAGIGAGGMDNQKRTLSQDGYELRFAVNYLAPFLLTHLLLPNLRRVESARIVNVASAGQHPLDFADVMLTQGFTGRRAYGQSKLAQILFTFELAERLRGSGITVNCQHPGSLLDTKMVRETFGQPWGKPESGAEAEVYLATSPALADVTGQYFDQTTIATANPQAYDPQARLKLWELSEQLTGITEPIPHSNTPLR